MTPTKLKNWRWLSLSLAVLAAACIGGIVRELTLQQRDARLQSAFQRIVPGMPLTEVKEQLGRPPDAESTDEVVFNGYLLMSAENPRARDDGPAQEYHILVWHGGRQRLTVLVDSAGHVRGRKLWDTAVPGSFWRRLVNGLTGWF